MDEILFRLSSQLEALQIQASVTTQQCQQLVTTWLCQGQRLLESISNDLHGLEVREFIYQVCLWCQKQIQTLQYNLASISFNARYVHQQLRDLLTLKALNWYNPRHLHHMKAIVCHNYVGIEGVSTIDDSEMPTIKKSNELLIQVKAACIHDVDIKICSGYSRTYRRLLNSGKNKDLPVILGRDCAGVVVDIGQNVINFDIGDKVFLAVPSWSTGTMAEYIVVTENRVAKMPKILPYEASASLPYSGCIAWDALINGSVIKEGNAKGKRVLVYGGTTPVGCILIQLVKLWGGYVVATCRSEAAPIIKALGAEEIIFLNDLDASKELELHNKYDAIFYTGGQLKHESSLKKYMLPYGSYVSTIPEYLASDSLGYVSGSLFSGCIRIKLLFQYFLGVSTYHWKEGSKLNSSYLQSLQELADANKLKPVLHKIYAPHNIDQAMAHIVDFSAIGSTVIKF
ncbi:reticulon-4-interacting protein 1, mitochondrial-like isoform X2 [Phymastichus coffea]|uniref:reticulon-4-interacting protein 1, mitochondrial-like isoform X2 n=1 Tax=Phymastichus coffea TaxID=108790 RepID=UPI00273CC564|nr:reticulon-4-interacting protein 1, mitochondrial-like isoform X2 [Phymastichus coffea]